MFSREDISVTVDGDVVAVTVDDTTHKLTRSAARVLSDRIGDTLTHRREFLRTSGEYREDGSYVVARRSADSAGNAKVFESFSAARRLYERLPARFDAGDVGQTGVTGSRRHMLVRHFAEHPAFDCELESRNPLVARKREQFTEDEVSVPGD